MVLMNEAGLPVDPLAQALNDFKNVQLVLQKEVLQAELHILGRPFLLLQLDVHVLGHLFLHLRAFQR